ncbi:hypothetical protein GCM10025794_37120 [Massilia kyonggiensis]
MRDVKKSVWHTTSMVYSSSTTWQAYIAEQDPHDLRYSWLDGK